MSFDPIHWFPPRLRSGAYLIGGAAFGLLCAFGTTRMIAEREWGYAVATAAMTVLFVLGAWAAYLELKATHAEEPAAEFRRRGGGVPPIG